MRNQLHDNHEGYDHEKEQVRNQRDAFRVRMERAEARVVVLSASLRALYLAGEAAVEDGDLFSVVENLCTALLDARDVLAGVPVSEEKGKS